MTPRKTIAGLSATAILMGGVDASVLNEKQVERLEIIANERVEARQIGNVVETKLPWKGEEGIVVKYNMGSPTISERVKDKRKKEVITETVDFGDGGFKVDILLNEKPDTNRFCYDIEGAENYDFYYQAPLTKKEIAEGTSRPPEIEGSYAVYHKTLKNHKIGAENYATGKVMHIPRPQVWELNNEEATKEWAELSYDNGELCVTVNQEFFDNANYPVRVDPTFGYTSVGGSSISAVNIVCSLPTSPTEDGTITSMTAYRQDTSSPYSQMATAVYDESGGTPVNLLAQDSGNYTFTSTTADWYTTNLSYAFTASTPYWLCSWMSNTTGTEPFFYDTTGSASIRRGNGTFDTFPATWSASSQITTAQASIYATYTAAGGGGSSPPQPPISFQ